MRGVLLGLILSSILYACAVPTPAQQTIHLQSEFRIEDIAWSTKQGSGSISGQAVLRTNGGEARTCAGYEVILVPESGYAKERLQYIYGSTEKGYREIFLFKDLKFSPEIPAYQQSFIKTVCDAQGNFLFEKLAAGTYFITAPVTWTVGRASQGGVLMQRVTVTDGESKRHILTR